MYGHANTAPLQSTGGDSASLLYDSEQQAREKAIVQSRPQAATAQASSQQPLPLNDSEQQAQETMIQPDSSRVWTLEDCLRHALDSNISLRQQRNTLLSSLEDTKAAKGAFLPSVSASSTQGYNHYSTGENTNSYTGTYNLSADMTLFSGGKIIGNYRLAKAQNRIDSLYVEERANDIRIAIVQAYMQCLYSRESVSVNEGNAASSKAQMERGEALWKAGSISKVDYAQLQSQYQSDEYQVIVARNTYESDLLTLKQLLELDITDEIELSDVDASEEQILALVPAKREIYENAKACMPQMQRAQESIQAARYSEQIAKAGYLPSISLSAGIGSSNNSVSSESFSSQISDNFNQSVGLTLRVPIFSQFQNRTTLAKARISLEDSRLEALSVEKELLKDVESTYLNALAAQSQYIAAKQKSSYTSESYALTLEQFNLGAKNTVELLTAQNEDATARQEVIIAKYTALMNLAVLDIYQGKI